VAKYPAHFWKYPAKYPAKNLGDAHFANFRSLAVSGMAELSGPDLKYPAEISGQLSAQK
jgi:hypothetical protein